MTVIPIVTGECSTVTKGVVQGLVDLDKRTNGNHLDYSIDEIGHNTEKSPGDLRSLRLQ